MEALLLLSVFEEVSCNSYGYIIIEVKPL